MPGPAAAEWNGAAAFSHTSHEPKRRLQNPAKQLSNHESLSGMDGHQNFFSKTIFSFNVHIFRQYFKKFQDFSEKWVFFWEMEDQKSKNFEKMALFLR